jgi:prevent-host-death family protein
MVKVSISDLKAKLSEHVRRVKGGEEVLVTEHGRAVAVLSPVPPGHSEDAELDELVDSGLVRPASRPFDDAFWSLPRGSDPERAVLETLLRERREGR